MTHGIARGGSSDEAARQPPERFSVEAFERLKQLVAAAEDDIKKAEGGNKAAGTRARQFMQDVKNAAQDVRQQVLTIRDQPAPGSGS
ncbi:MAG: hypothetical protein ACKVU4_02170 [Phycisphaerales bacterium]